MEQSKPNGNKVINAFVLFFIIVFIVNSLVVYYQSSSMDSTIQLRTVVGDEILDTVKKQSIKLEEIQTSLQNTNAKIANLEENLKKAGHSNK